MIYRIDFREVTNLHAQIANKSRILEGQLNHARTQMQTLRNSSAMKGQTATAIQRTIENVHIPLLELLCDILVGLDKEVGKAIQELRDNLLERDANAILDYDTIANVKERVRNAFGEKEEIDGNIKKIYSNLEDILSLSMPSTSAFENHYNQAIREMDRTMERLQTFQRNFERIDRMVDQAQRQINRAMAVSALPLDAPDRIAFMHDASFKRFASSVREEHSVFREERQRKLEEFKKLNPVEMMLQSEKPWTKEMEKAWHEKLLKYYHGYIPAHPNAVSRWSEMADATGSFVEEVTLKSVEDTIGIGADIARVTKDKKQHFGRAVVRALHPRDLNGQFISDTSNFNRIVKKPFFGMSRTATGQWVGRAVGGLLRGFDRGLAILGAVGDFRDHFDKHRDVGRAISFTGYTLGANLASKKYLKGETLTNIGNHINTLGKYIGKGKAGKVGSTISMIGNSVSTVGNGATGVGTKIVGGLGTGLKKVGLGVVGVKAAPILVTGVVLVGAGRVAKWAYNNVPVVQNAVRAVGDGINAIGRAVGGLGRALNPFNWGRSD